MKRQRRVKFGGDLLTWDIPKYVKDTDGNDISEMNKRVMMKKALRAYLRGEPFYRYKGLLYAVPLLSNKTIEDVSERKEES